MRVKKHSILLLEVLIAFAIIVLCIFPLIYPHAAMAKAQKEFVQKVRLNHAITLLYGQIYQDLLANRIEWTDISNKRRFEIPPADLQKFVPEYLPYKGWYQFELKSQKPSQPQDKMAYIYTLKFTFEPVKPIKKKQKTPKPLEYNYQIFILRDLKAQDQSPADEE